MSFTFVDVIGLTAVYVFVHWQTTSSSAGSGRDRRWYESGSRRIRSKGGCAPPGWLFGVAWWTLYNLITAALFIAYREFPDTKWTYLAIFITASVNVLLNKAWSMLFWDFGRTGWSLVVAFLMLDSAIAVLVFVGLTQEAPLWGLVFGLYIPYAVWLLVAIYLNWWWYREGLSTTLSFQQASKDAMALTSDASGYASMIKKKKKKGTRNGAQTLVPLMNHR